MCKKIEASRSEKVVAYTVDPPYSKGTPGYVAVGSSHDDVIFTEELWMAWAQDREVWARWLPSINARTKKEVYVHSAVAMLVTPA